MQVPREGLEQKLQRLSQSQQSIESVSSFCIFYHKDARGVVAIWDVEFYKAPADRQLALLFLANHILQEGRKKGMAFQEEFFKVLPKAVAHMSKHGDDKAKRSVGRMVNVWEERRVFGTRHIKSFRDLLGVAAAAAGGSGGGGGGSSGGGSTDKPSGSAAAGGGSGGGSASVAKLGPAGEALALVLQRSAAAAAKEREFTGSWCQGVLTTGGLPEVTAAHSKAGAYSAALQQEVAARQAALAALAAETARQSADLARAEAALRAVGGQAAQLESRLAVLTSQMTSAMASLGQLFQQNGGGAAAGAAAAPPAAAAVAAEDGGGGSPQAPELELEDDDDPDVAYNPAQPAAPAAAVAPVLQPGVLDPNLLSMLQQQQQQQPDLQALLQNPAMLSAAITGAIAPAAAAAAPMLGGLPLGPVAAGYGGLPGGQDMAGGGFGGGLMGLEQQQSGFADEGEDPYDPERPD